VQYITADSYTLMQQASMTAHDYLLAAVRDIDAILGDGYAAKHPELIGAFMQTAALDFAAGIIGKTIERVADAIDDASTNWLNEQP
jgi:hypothetical protein